MKKLVGILMDENKINLAVTEMNRCGLRLKKMRKNYLAKIGLSREMQEIYISKINEGGVLLATESRNVDKGREILEQLGAEQIRTV